MSTAASNRPRLVAIIGTRAQTIKMAPLLAELERRELPYRLLLTGQHHATIDALLDEFDIRTARERLYDGPEIKGMLQAARWLLTTAWTLWHRRNDWAPCPRRETIVLAHGDTFTTLLAAGMGWLLGACVAHVEAGLRSFDWRHPFPEELTRRIVTRLAHIAYCPGQWACDNLAGHRLAIIDTQANTILDALRQALAQPARQAAAIDTPYAVVSLHRFENLHSRERMTVILRTIRELARRLRVILVLHPTTEKRLTELGELDTLRDNPGIELRPRMTYIPFMQLVSGARLVVSDGGSNQEELSYLGIPTLLMRMATERQEGLDQNVTLSRFDPERITSTINCVTREPTNKQANLPDTRPVEIITDDLADCLSSSAVRYSERPR